MAFRVLFIAHAPDGNAKVHRSRITTGKMDFTAVIVKDQAQAIQAVEDMVADGNVDSILLCPGFRHEDVAEIAKVAGEKVGVSVARGDGRSMALAREAMNRARWFE